VVIAIVGVLALITVPYARRRQLLSHSDPIKEATQQAALTGRVVTRRHESESQVLEITAWPSGLVVADTIKRNTSEQEGAANALR
jgi:hypothetical protein